jgi:hypothetical protein
MFVPHSTILVEGLVAQCDFPQGLRYREFGDYQGRKVCVKIVRTPPAAARTHKDKPHSHERKLSMNANKRTPSDAREATVHISCASVAPPAYVISERRTVQLRRILSPAYRSRAQPCAGLGAGGAAAALGSE